MYPILEENFDSIEKFSILVIIDYIVLLLHRKYSYLYPILEENFDSIENLSMLVIIDYIFITWKNFFKKDVIEHIKN